MKSCAFDIFTIDFIDSNAFIDSHFKILNDHKSNEKDHNSKMLPTDGPTDRQTHRQTCSDTCMRLKRT